MSERCVAAPTLEDHIDLHAEMVALNQKISERLVCCQQFHEMFNLQAQIDALQEHIQHLKGGK